MTTESQQYTRSPYRRSVQPHGTVAVDRTVRGRSDPMLAARRCSVATAGRCRRTWPQYACWRTCFDQCDHARTAGRAMVAVRWVGIRFDRLSGGIPWAGKIVPVEVTVRLLKKAMDESGKTKFLIDGFPRNMNNVDVRIASG